MEARGLLKRFGAFTAVNGLDMTIPRGAFYAFPNVSAHFGKRIDGQAVTDAASFSSALLEKNHVAVVPGNDSGFDTHVRLSFATGMEQIDRGIDRISRFLASLK